MKVAIFGANGRLGQTLCKLWGEEFEILPVTRAEANLDDPVAFETAADAMEFDVAVNCAAATNVDGCEKDPESAERINSHSPACLARLCTRRGVRLIHISTDYVFDGQKLEPYLEDDRPNPLGVYGRTKKSGEDHVLQASPRHAVVRVSWVFGPEKPSFIDAILKRAQEEETIEAIGDKTSSPSYAIDLADWLKPLAADASLPGGIYHACNSGVCSWRDYGEYAIRQAIALGVPMKTDTVGFIPLDSMDKFIAPRPRQSALASPRLEQNLGMTPRPWQEAVADFVRRKFG